MSVRNAAITWARRGAAGFGRGFTRARAPIVYYYCNANSYAIRSGLIFRYV